MARKAREIPGEPERAVILNLLQYSDKDGWKSLNEIDSYDKPLPREQKFISGYSNFERYLKQLVGKGIVESRKENYKYWKWRLVRDKKTVSKLLMWFVQWQEPKGTFFESQFSPFSRIFFGSRYFQDLKQPIKEFLERDIRRYVRIRKLELLANYYRFSTAQKAYKFLLKSENIVPEEPSRERWEAIQRKLKKLKEVSSEAEPGM